MALLSGKAEVREREELECFGLRQLRFQDVTKYFPLGHVSIVVTAEGRNDVHPLILEGIKVKARKRTNKTE